MCYLGFPAVAGVPAPPEQQTEPTKERAPAPYADEFMMWCFKVVECDNPEHTRDDWDTCPFAHAGEVVTRRPPQAHLPKLCPKARRACRKGRACPYAHNVFEHWLHPSRFKTEICQHGSACDRPMCFFAHYSHEIRHPSPSADEVMAAAEAAGLLGRLHAHSAASASAGAAAAPAACSSAASCGRASATLYDSSGGGSSRRSSLTNHDSFGCGGSTASVPSAPWLAQPALTALPPQAQVQPQAHVQAAPQAYGALGVDLTFAAQCLQAQQRAHSAAAAGWSGSEWAILSGGAGAPAALLPAARDAPLTGGLQLGATAPHAALGTLSSGSFALWGAAQQVPPPVILPAVSAAGGGAPLAGLSSEEALCLLASLNGPQAPTSAYLNLSALQAEQARVAALAGFF